MEQGEVRLMNARCESPWSSAVFFLYTIWVGSVSYLLFRPFPHFCYQAIYLIPRHACPEICKAQ
jgi:hypothetical protein